MKFKMNWGGLSFEAKGAGGEGKGEIKELEVEKEMTAEEFQGQLDAGVKIIESGIRDIGNQIKTIMKEWEESQIRIKAA